MRHLRTVTVTHGFGERATGADPAAVGTLAPAKNNQRNDDKGLQETNHEPKPDRLIGKDIVDIQWEGENESVSPPVSPQARFTA